MTARKPVYMMHPLGAGPDREKNRHLACLWQAAIQHDHPEWIVLAPWIGLSGAWSEDRREEGLAIDFATIDLCEGRTVIAGTHMSPRMIAESEHVRIHYPHEKPFDARGLYSFTEKSKSDFKPRFEQGQKVMLENTSLEFEVVTHEEVMPGVFRYLVERQDQRVIDEQRLTKI